MNNLNSILLEGVISGKPGMVGRGETRHYAFMVSSLRYLHKGENVEKQETSIWVRFRNTNLVQGATKNAYDGRGVRVVGRIANDEDSGIYIEAEHIGYRPEPKKTEA